MAADAPKVTSIVRDDPAVTTPGLVRYTVSFSEPVTGVDASVFALQGNQGASIRSVSSGSGGAQYVVTVQTGGSAGTFNLALTDSGKIHDLAGNGLYGGQFAQSVQYNVPGASVAIDIDGDGKLDRIVAGDHSSYFQFETYIGNGDGSFQVKSGVTATSTSLFQLGDVNQDGHADIVSAASDGLHIFTGDGAGYFQPGATQALGGSPVQLALGDFNGDGIPDAVVSLSGSNSMSVLLGNGSGSFGTAAAYATAGAATTASTVIATGDFNHDGKLDIAAVDDRQISILLGNGDGTFGAPLSVPVYFPGDTGGSLAVADLNRDGNPDLVQLTQGGGFTTYLGDGAGHFSPFFATTTSTSGSGVSSVIDLDGDGVLDVVYHGSSSVFIAKGIGNGAFQSPATFQLPEHYEMIFVPQTYIPGLIGGHGYTYTRYYPYNVLFGDFTGDGRPDIVATAAGPGSDYLLTNVVPTVQGPTYTIKTQPVVSNVSTNVGAYSVLRAGDTAAIALTTDRAVTVQGGTPSLTLNDGAVATYDAAHSTGTSLAFNYAVHAGDNSAGLATAALALNGATIADADGLALNTAGARAALGGVQVETAVPIYFSNQNDGRVVAWHLSGGTVIDKAVIDQATTDWNLVGVTNLAGSRPVEVFQNVDGRVVTARTDAFQHAAGALVVGNAPTSWHYGGSGDLFGTGDLDLVWRNDDGRLMLWAMSTDGAAKLGEAIIEGPSADWHLFGVGDFNGDGHSDLLWQNDDGRVVEWLMSGMIGDPKPVGQQVDAPSADWHVAGIGDINGDKLDDILYLNADGTVAFHDSAGSGNQVLGKVSTDWQIAGLRDINYDKHADIIFHNTSGDIAAWTSQANSSGYDHVLIGHATPDWHVMT